MDWFEWPRRMWIGTLLVAAAAGAMLLTGGAAHAADAAALKTESPYFAVHSSDPGVDRLPLKATRVQVRILGPIADVTVTQHYRNEGERAIDARYVFPGGAQSAVHAMQVRLGERVLRARIKEKQAARIEFEQARSEGKTAALLEQQRPNVFQMNVAHILPGDEVQVELRYTELLVPRDGRYEFVYPTVVGPRYNSPQGPAAREKWVSTPHLRAGEAPSAAFDLQLTLATPVAPKDVASPSHPIEVTFAGDRRVEVGLRGAGSGPHANRDFILHYGLAGDAIASGLTLFEGAGEKFFLAVVEPPKSPPLSAIVPRDYIFVVDISGSMHGFPLDTAKVLMQDLLSTLRPTDSFNVLLFSGSSRKLAPHSVPATQANIAAALRLLRETGGGGSTEIVPALQQVARLPKAPELSRSVVVITDGYVSVERDVFRLVRRELGASNVFAFGIGSSVNRHLIEGIARAGHGEAFVVTRREQAPEQAARFRRMIDAPVLTQVKARFEGLQVVDVEPAHLPDVMAGRPLVLWGRWKGEPRGALVVEGNTAQGTHRSVIDAAGAVAPEAEALRHLWARQRIAALSDEEALVGAPVHKEEITKIGLRYSLLTDYTSFIAVDQRVRNRQPAANENVDQPLPLPEGVSELAVGAEVPTTPEPQWWAAMAVMLAVLGVAGLRRRRA